mmetsp:Transcript_2518/g.3668  ORF Transcript_2518/g.3668 Transcript_2518/m.3668 type:complete len:155 (+) Transcript_2518:74-538(+)
MPKSKRRKKSKQGKGKKESESNIIGSERTEDENLGLPEGLVDWAEGEVSEDAGDAEEKQVVEEEEEDEEEDEEEVRDDTHKERGHQVRKPELIILDGGEARSQTQCSVHVTQLPYEATKAEIINIFKSCSKLGAAGVDCRMVMDKNATPMRFKV